MKQLLFAFLLAVASTVANAQDCTVNPAACQAKPVPSTCPAGKHWTTMGSGIAHCVLDDPVCVAPEKLKHDALGNPSCVAPVITYDWEYRTYRCTSGKLGSREQKRKLTYTDGVLTDTGSWTTYENNCYTPEPAPEPTPTPAPGGNPAPAPGVTCWTDQWTNTYECPPGTYGSHTSTTYRTCPNGPYAADYTYEGPHSINCSSTPPPTTTPPPSGGSGSSGGSTPDPGPVPTCKNGASDYPTCTPPSCGNGATNYPSCNSFPSCSNGATNYPSCNAFPGCPYAGQSAGTSCDFQADGAQGGGDCIEGTYVWQKAVYNSDASCSTRVVESGSAGGYQGYCPGRSGGGCPSGY